MSAPIFTRIIHEVDGELGDCQLPSLPRQADWVQAGDDTYEVRRVIWNLNQSPATVDLIVDDPRY